MMTSSEELSSFAQIGDGRLDANRKGQSLSIKLFMIGIEGKLNAAQSTERALLYVVRPTRKTKDSYCWDNVH
jgi:hypothetical protein